MSWLERILTGIAKLSVVANSWILKCADNDSGRQMKEELEEWAIDAATFSSRLTERRRFPPPEVTNYKQEADETDEDMNDIIMRWEYFQAVLQKHRPYYLK